MTQETRREPLPMLTNPVVPGDRLRHEGLWLPVTEPPPTRAIEADDVDWRTSVPEALREHADSMADDVARQVRGALPTGRRPDDPSSDHD